MPTLTLSEVKRGLGGLWAKGNDRSETYEFDLTGDRSWGCTRDNAAGSRRFGIFYDKDSGYVWWGQSYFLDPSEFSKAPNKASWYRASDLGKRKVSFAWVRLREASPEPPAKVASAKAAMAKTKVLAKAQPKYQPKAQPKYQPNSSPSPTPPGSGGGERLLRSRSMPAEGREQAPVRAGPRAKPPGGSAAAAWHPPPEVMWEREGIIVIYKPPHWKCELPAKEEEQGNPPPEDGSKRGYKDHLVPRWLKEKVPNIDAELFEEEFNPALSGTGFGPLAHRIDAETSGPLLVVKTACAQKHLKSQFHKTQVSKRYLCLVHGQMAKASGVVDASIRTLRTGSSTRSEISSAGEWAETKYELVAVYRAEQNSAAVYSLVACDITSGRTHQIRVHMLHLGHPLVSDEKYLAPEMLQEDRSWCQRLFLHCYRLCFVDLRSEPVQILCPLPNDLRTALLSRGAAIPTPDLPETLFGETSFNCELFRPPLSHWQPSTRVLRRVMTLLGPKSPQAVPLSELNADGELRQLMAEEGIPRINKAWLSRHWVAFEAWPVEGAQDELSVSLRPEHAAAGDSSFESDLEKRIEVVRCDLEDLQRQKQRYVAQEEYIRAADVKRRVEVVSAELASLLLLAEGDDEVAEVAGRRSDSVPPQQLRHGDLEERAKRDLPASKVPLKKAQAFTQDVGDEQLFPSLVPSTTKALPSKSVVASTTFGANTGVSGTNVSASAGAQPPSAVGSSVALARELPPTPVEQATTKELDLKEELVEFLKKRDHNVAHINEVNNDKFLRQVMALQQPKPIMAINKAWLGKHEGTFAVLRTQEGETYIALEQAKIKGQDTKRPGEKVGESGRSQAYHHVVQRFQVDGATPLVYPYSTAARVQERTGDTPAAAEATTGTAAHRASSSKRRGDGGSAWKEKFMAALRQNPQRMCTAEELLEAVPSFADAMGARKPRELRDILLIFLRTCSDTFAVETKQALGGSKKTTTIWMK